ncbi:MAG: SDR family NAD(P)-dependent oxidoreductase, partial [Reyranella sp.]|nr:SDR family NAD(P)-dependent oxidoreductase [Reyranella sp.]
MTGAPNGRTAGGRLAGRIALITGASRGLGAAAALAYAGEGAHCVLVARTVGGLEALDDQIKAVGGTATLVPLDVTDGPGIDRLGAALHERFGRLDVLLGNAGVLGALSPIGHIEPKLFEQIMAVNVTANWRLIRSLDPLLRASDAGRAIFVTSGISRRVVAYWSAYAASKAA